MMKFKIGNNGEGINAGLLPIIFRSFHEVYTELTAQLQMVVFGNYSLCQESPTYCVEVLPFSPTIAFGFLKILIRINKKIVRETKLFYTIENHVIKFKVDDHFIEKYALAECIFGKILKQK